MKREPERGDDYRCPACGQILKRESKKQWMVSYCEQAGRKARLQRVDKSRKITKDHIS